MRLTKFNPETGQYEYIEKAKTLDEFKAQRKAAIQRLGEYEYQEAYYDWSLSEETQEYIRKLIAGNIHEFQVNTAEEAELLETNVALFLDHLVDTLLEMDDHIGTVLYEQVVSAITLEFGAFCTALDEKFKEKNDEQI